MILFIEILGHLANIIYVVALMIKNIIWLRLFLIFGAVLEITYSYFISPVHLWVNIFWAFMFILVNSYHLFILFKEKISLKLTEDEERLYKLVFFNIEKLTFAKMIKMAEWNIFKEGTVILKEGSVNDKLIVIYSGIAEVKSNNQTLAYLKDGNFIGEMSYITGEVISANVVSLTELKIIYWDLDDLNKLLTKVPDLVNGLKTSLNVDLVNKLMKRSV